MASVLKRIYDKIFHVYDRRDTAEWEHEPVAGRPIYGVYHVMCDTGWERLVARQVATLKQSRLLDATATLFVSVIAKDKADVERLREMIGSGRMKIISCVDTPTRYEYPALEHVKRLADSEDCMIYYFHTKGISYQAVNSNDATFRSFRRKIDAWTEMLEYFIFTKWRVAVNALAAGYDTYGCYRWPPRNYTMFSGNFWWVSSAFARTLPDFSEEVTRADRFYSEVWLFQEPNNVFSPFESVVDLYFVRIPRSVYASAEPPLKDRLAFAMTYNWRKLLKHAFGYNYKKNCQKRFQKLKHELK